MLLALLLIVASSGPIPTTGPPPPAELKQLRAQLTDALNRHRAQYGLPPLVTDPIAEQAAQDHADEMMETGQLVHEDSRGQLPMARYGDLGGKADFYGENVGSRKPGVLDPALLWDAIAKLDQDMMAEVPPDDGHRRNILSSRFSAVGIGVAVGPNGVFMDEDFVGFRVAAASTPGPISESELDTLRSQLLDALNRHRAKAGLPPLRVDPVAQQAAQFQADDMAAAGMLRHTDSRGRNPYQRYQAFGGSIRSIGENVANDSSVTLDPTLIWTVMSGLDADMMAEKAPNDGHRRNILASIFNEVGIGIAVSKSGVFFCEDFSGPPLPG